MSCDQLKKHSEQVSGVDIYIYIYIYIYLKNIQAESRSDQGLSSSKKDKEAPSMHNENSPHLMPYIYSIPGLHVEKNKSLKHIIKDIVMCLKV